MTTRQIGAIDDVMVHQLMADIEKAPEPVVPSDEDQALGIIQKPTVERPPMVRSTVESAGYYYLYRMTDGKRVLVNGNMVPSKLRQVLPDGRPAFSAKAPKNVPPEHLPGTLTCWLHPGRPERKRYGAMGLPQCSKEGFQNEMQVREHVRIKHRNAWRVIAELQEREQREVDRELQRSVIAALSGARPPAAARPEAPPMVRVRKPKARAGAARKRA